MTLKLKITVMTKMLLQNVIDGDLCEMFNSMDPGKQKSVAEELDRTPSEVNIIIYTEHYT